MSFARLQKIVTYLLSGLGLTALSFGGELPPGVLVVIGLGFVASWFAEAPRIAQPVYIRGFTALVVLGLFAQIFRGLSGGGGWLGLVMEFAAFLSISRLFNRRSAAEYQQIAVLAFMHLIAATVLTSDLGYAGVFVAFVVATPWVLTFAHLRAEIERNYPKDADADHVTDAARVLGSRRIVGPSFLAWTALLSVPMFAMTLVLFILFPRVGLGFVSFGKNRGQAVAGFGNQVELGGFGVIRDDPTVVLRVTPSRALDAQESQRYLRLRGTAFDSYDGRRWTRTEGDPVSMRAIDDYYPLRRMEDRRRDFRFKIVLDRLDEPVLFVPTGTVGLRIPSRAVPGRANRTRVERRHGLDLRYTSGDDLGIVYEAVASMTESELDVPATRDVDGERYLALPPGHERVTKLARGLARGLSAPSEIARRFESYLRDEGRYQYSLEQPRVGTRWPLEVFLFEARRGHCEYFATALAIMLRAVDIPSRNVTGFVGGEYNPYGRYYGMRQSDAHSWVEALVPGRGWMTLDPTPFARDRLGASHSLFADWNNVVDAMRSYWMTQVLSYDLRAQVGMLRSLREWSRGLSMPSFGVETRNEAEPDHRANPTGGRSTRTLGLFVVGVGLLAAAAVLALRSLARRKKKPALGRSARAAQKLYRELERVLARKGRARPPHVSPQAHARALSQSGFAAAGAVEELTQVYVEARYGAGDLPEARLERARARLAEIRRAA